jgi:hypothetical protein
MVDGRSQMWYNAPSWSVNTMDDVDKYLSELRDKLAVQLDRQEIIGTSRRQ